MHAHGPEDFIGPVRGSTAWWRGIGTRPEESSDGPPHPKQRRGKRTKEPISSDDTIREELVSRIKREIAEGTYDTPEKWERALSRLLDGLTED